MKLDELVTALAGLTQAHSLDPATLESEVIGVTSDSRELKPGMIFVAIQGGQSDGHAWIDSALGAGARAVVTEREVTQPHLLVKNTRAALGVLADHFYAHPSRALKLIGITGTSGKTTTSYLIESVLKSSGLKAGLIGTIEYRIDGKAIPSTHTTPGAVELQRLLAQMRDAGCKAVVMEVSSHSLKQHRVTGTAFDAVVFTNLSAEHLDFHADMEDYFNSKAMLFREVFEDSIRSGKSPTACINADDPYGRRLLEELKNRSVIAFSSTGALVASAQGIRGVVDGISVDSNLVGPFNVENILAAIAATTAVGINRPAIESGIKNLAGVPGRLEQVKNDLGIQILVDYAHKPDALEKILTSLIQVKGASRIITVFGCGGDRDRRKRPVMGEIASRLSDQVILTSDNPRTEDPNAILDEIEKGLTGRLNYLREPDRRKAITLGIRLCHPGDLLLIAGKGHETYQIIGQTQHPFDDREVARRAAAAVSNA